MARVSFNGTLLKLGNYTFPLKYINAKSYKGQYITQDVDSTTTADGVLHRNVVPHRVPKVTFETMDGLTHDQLASIMTHLQSNYTTSQAEKKVRATVYINELDDYVTENMYLKPDMEFPIDYIEDNVIYYEPISFVFVGY